MALKKTTLSEDVFLTLKNKILESEYKPGDRLKQDALCAELGVSSSPVREALQKLEQEGWIENRPRKGRTVRAVDIGEIRDIYKVRAVLEALAAELAAPKFDPETAGAARDAAKAIRDAVLRENPRELIDAETRFHRLIAERSGNKTLLEFFTVLIQRGRALLTSSALFERPGNVENAEKNYRSHLAIVDALEKGDGEAAAALLRDHLRGAFSS